MNVANTNASSGCADATIITNDNNRLEVSYDELVQLDNFLSRELPALNEKVYRQAPPIPKFSRDNPTDLRYLTDADIEKANERSRKYNERIETARANTTSATRIGRLSVSVNAIGETTVVDGSHSITMGASAWHNEKEAVESCQRAARVRRIIDTFGEYPRNVNL
jgi:hypothetical protein